MHNKLLITLNGAGTDLKDTIKSFRVKSEKRALEIVKGIHPSILQSAKWFSSIGTHFEADLKEEEYGQFPYNYKGKQIISFQIQTK